MSFKFHGYKIRPAAIFSMAMLVLSLGGFAFHDYVSIIVCFMGAFFFLMLDWGKLMDKEASP